MITLTFPEGTRPGNMASSLQFDNDDHLCAWVKEHGIEGTKALLDVTIVKDKLFYGMKENGKQGFAIISRDADKKSE